MASDDSQKWTCPHFGVYFGASGGNCHDCGAWVGLPGTGAGKYATDLQSTLTWTHRKHGATPRALIGVRIPLRLPTHGISRRSARKITAYHVAVHLANILAVIALAWLGFQ